MRRSTSSGFGSGVIVSFIKWLRLAWRVRSKAAFEREIETLKAKRLELQGGIEDQIYRTLGVITHSWAGLEVTLDLVNWAIASHQIEKEPFPVALSRKVRFFRDAHNKNPLLRPIRSEAAAIADAIAEAGKLRHDLIHGFVRDGMHQPILTIYKHYVPRGADSHNMYTDEVSVSREQLFELGRTIHDLGDRLARHADILVPTLALAKSQEAAEES